MGRPKGKASAGQPAGSRTASGRKRDRTPVRVTPAEGVMRRRAAFGVAAEATGDASERQVRMGRQETDTCDALGRAYCAGLLGSAGEADRRLIAGRRIAAFYWREYGFPTQDSLAKFQPFTGAPMGPALVREQEDALSKALSAVQARGHGVRAAFDQLVIDLNPDQGPAWLDRLATGVGTAADRVSLAKALAGLEAVA